VTLTLSFGIGQAGTLPNDTVEKASFIVKHFPAASGTDHPPSPIGGGTVSLIGDPDSKTFGVSFNGPLTSSASLTGKEKLVVSLYINCDGMQPGNRVTVGSAARARRICYRRGERLRAARERHVRLACHSHRRT
jgi:hypothetical protein